MPQSLVNILAHIIFSTKNRANLITPEIESDLLGYMHGIIENNKSKLLLANGTSDHVHMLVSLGRTISISELIGDIERDSQGLNLLNRCSSPSATVFCGLRIVGLRLRPSAFGSPYAILFVAFGDGENK